MHNGHFQKQSNRHFAYMPVPKIRCRVPAMMRTMRTTMSPTRNTAKSCAAQCSSDAYAQQTNQNNNGGPLGLPLGLYLGVSSSHYVSLYVRCVFLSSQTVAVDLSLCVSVCGCLLPPYVCLSVCLC